MSRPSSAPDGGTARPPDVRFVRRLAPFARPHARGLLAGTVLLPCVAGLELVEPLIVRAVIDRHVVPRRLDGLEAYVLLLLAVLVAKVAARYVQTYAMNASGQRIVRDLRAALFRHLHQLPERWFDRVSAGRALARVTHDVEGIQDLFSAGVVSIVADVVTLVGIGVAMLVLDVELALVTFAALPLLIPLVVALRRRLRDAYREIRRVTGDLTAYLEETLGGLGVILTTGYGPARFEGFREHSDRYRRACVHAIHGDAALFAGVELVGTLAAAALLRWAAPDVLAGTLSFGTLYAFLDYVHKLFVPVRDLSAKYAMIQSGLASCERVFELLDEPTEPAARADRASPRAERGVVFDAVRFAYGDGPPVLDGVSFRVGPGETVAIVGATGAGKSTLVKLLVGLYRPTGGAIRIDGVDVRDLEPQALRRRVGMVLQDVHLFSRSLATNLAIGAPAPEADRVAAAVRAVGLEARVAALPHGLETRLGERGHDLAAGERQLLSYARALVKDPPILVLDEATSQIDGRTEARLRDATRSVIAGRTVLVVAHRLATITEASRIVVLAKGRVREQGTHAELLAQAGLYARFWELQQAEAAIERRERTRLAGPRDAPGPDGASVAGAGE